MRLVWRPMAMADRDRIFDYIAKDNPAAALALDEAFEAQADNAARSPKLYKPGRVPGTREIVVRPNYILIHQVSSGFQGQATDIEIHAKEIIDVRQRLDKILAKHTGQEYDKVRQDTERDYFMSSEEAQEYGIIDRVIAHH
mgnify:CR=1 FL=1